MRTQWKSEKIKNELEIAVKESLSISQALQKMGIKLTGGNYVSINKYIRIYGFDTSHWTGQGHLKDGTHNWGRAIPLDDILKDGTKYKVWSLKKRLFAEGFLINQCYICGLLPEWLGQELSLQMDHIDGNRYNNDLSNLRILCPNCHSQTPTFTGKNYGAYKDKKKGENIGLPKKEKVKCKLCNENYIKDSRASFCLQCYSTRRNECI